MKYQFYEDPGHAWLKVPYKKLVELGIENKITAYSYMKGEYVYLEEDCDAPTFIKAIESSDETFTYERNTSNRNSRIRSYPSYNNTITVIAIDTEEKYDNLMKILGWPNTK